MNCIICNAEVNRLYKHHLIPKSKGGAKGEIVECCDMCSQQIHMLFTEKELAGMSLEQLLADGKMNKFLKWRKNHLGSYTVRMSNKVKKWKKTHR